jgi:hypothetical protein
VGPQSWFGRECDQQVCADVTHCVILTSMLGGKCPSFQNVVFDTAVCGTHIVHRSQAADYNMAHMTVGRPQGRPDAPASDDYDSILVIDSSSPTDHVDSGKKRLLNYRARKKRNKNTPNSDRTTP